MLQVSSLSSPSCRIACCVPGLDVDAEHRRAGVAVIDPVSQVLQVPLDRIARRNVADAGFVGPLAEGAIEGAGRHPRGEIGPAAFLDEAGERIGVSQPFGKSLAAIGGLGEAATLAEPLQAFVR
jgi:hypothetical protein